MTGTPISNVAWSENLETFSVASLLYCLKTHDKKKKFVGARENKGMGAEKRGILLFVF
jgi:hypothetical protein